MKYGIILIGIAFIMASCNNPNRRTDPTLEDTSSPMMTGYPASSNNTEIELRNLDNDDDLNYYGVYEGTLPSGSGEGIETTVTINDDGTYNVKSVYLGKEGDNTFEENGRYDLSGDILTLRANGEEQYYRITNNGIYKLDNDKQTISGDLADNYRLKKK